MSCDDRGGDFVVPWALRTEGDSRERLFDQLEADLSHATVALAEIGEHLSAGAGVSRAAGELAAVTRAVRAASAAVAEAVHEAVVLEGQIDVRQAATSGAEQRAAGDDWPSASSNSASGAARPMAQAAAAQEA